MERLETYFLVEALKAGSLIAFEKIYKTYYSRLFGFAKKFGKARLEPDDFVQQTFMVLWEKKELLKEDVLLDKQIFVICRNIMLNQLNRDQKIRITGDIDEYLQDTSIDSQEEEDDEDINRKNRLHLIIDEMPEKRREVFLLHKINNLNYEEISESLGISKKTIANHIYLATTFLKEKI